MFILHKCVPCDGSGKSKIEVHSDGKVDVVEILCVDCNGLGLSSLSEAQQTEKIAQAQALWCQCAKSDPVYVPDAPGMKHHWDCGECGRLVQVG